MQKFFCLLYGAPKPEIGVNCAQYQMFIKGKKNLEALPPTLDALQMHTARGNFQAKVWYQFLNTDHSDLKAAECGGWALTDDGLAIMWKTLTSIPESCIQLIVCGCKTKCKSANCKCVKLNQKCIAACGCDGIDC